ncbi:hypothetical protein BDZ45DRAFT_354003 [Acephala macrosclerotiorum]|nr:hypothetical protein BDZ45DRAFT_354003 [Acephala macrosclerotiorum]
MLADSQLNAWIEDNNTTAGALDLDVLLQISRSVNNPAMFSRVLEGTSLLKEYGKAFERDVTPEIQAIIDLHQDTFDSYYEDMKRERSMKRMSKALRRQDLLL